MPSEGREGSLLSTQETSSAPVSGETEVKQQPDISNAAVEAQSKGFLGKLFGRFSRGKSSQVNQQPNQESEQQIRDRLARLQADRKNIQAAMNSSDSTGSSKIADAQRLQQIDQQLENLRQKLPAETIAATQQPAATKPDETEKAA